MPALFQSLRALENKYNGPIPSEEREAVLYKTSRAILRAQQATRHYQNRTGNDIEASYRLRTALGNGSLKRLSQIQDLGLRISICQSMLISVSQLLAWHIHLKNCNKSKP